MMSDFVGYASFMIRVWREPVASPAGEPAAEEGAWVGELESVQSGRIVSFRGLDALAELLVERLPDAVDFLE